MRDQGICRRKRAWQVVACVLCSVWALSLAAGAPSRAGASGLQQPPESGTISPTVLHLQGFPDNPKIVMFGIFFHVFSKLFYNGVV